MYFFFIRIGGAKSKTLLLFRNFTKYEMNGYRNNLYF